MFSQTIAHAGATIDHTHGNKPSH